MNFLASVLKYSHRLYDVIGERKATELEREKDLISAYFALVDVLLKLFVKLLKNQPNIQKVFLQIFHLLSLYDLILKLIDFVNVILASFDMLLINNCLQGEEIFSVYLIKLCTILT